MAASVFEGLASEKVIAELVFLSPYSPDLNPIKVVFAKIKQRLRSRACRTKDMLRQSMQSVLDTITEKDSRHCFKHCGHIATPETETALVKAFE